MFRSQIRNQIYKWQLVIQFGCPLRLVPTKKPDQLSSYLFWLIQPLLGRNRNWNVKESVAFANWPQENVVMNSTFWGIYLSELITLSGLQRHPESSYFMHQTRLKSECDRHVLKWVWIYIQPPRCDNFLHV